MPITLQLPDGRNWEFPEDTTITIGTDASNMIRLTGPMAAVHARIRRLAGRWLIESAGDWPIQAGSALPARVCWLKVGDVIRLTRNGPEIVFEPPLTDVVLDGRTEAPVARVPSYELPNFELPSDMGDEEEDNLGAGPLAAFRESESESVVLLPDNDEDEAPDEETGDWSHPSRPSPPPLRPGPPPLPHL